MLIGELVKRSGLSKDTIRYYEKIGVLNKKVVQKNPENGYRIYNEQALELLKMLEIGKQHGATLNEIKTILDAHHEDNLTCQFMAPFLRQKLKEIEQKIEDLKQQKQNLEETLNVVDTCLIKSTTGKDFISLI